MEEMNFLSLLVWQFRTPEGSKSGRMFWTFLECHVLDTTVPPKLLTLAGLGLGLNWAGLGPGCPVPQPQPLCLKGA